MTLSDMTTMLKGITGFENKVAYRTFPDSEVPALPYICFTEADPVVFYADNTAYYIQGRYTVDLYERYRDGDTEGAVEAAFASEELAFTRVVSYIDSEKCWDIAYTLTTKGV